MEKLTLFLNIHNFLKVQIEQKFDNIFKYISITISFILTTTS
jgi:hypothetical protein